MPGNTLAVCEEILMWFLQSFIFLLNKVAIRHANVIDLRIGGSVEIANVEINPVSMLTLFDRVYECGDFCFVSLVHPFMFKNILLYNALAHRNQYR